MEQILFIREICISYFRRYENIVLFIFKFFIGVLVFSQINSIGYNIDVFSRLVTMPYSLFYVFLMAILFAIVPISFSYGLMILNIGIQTSQSIVIMAFLVLFLLCILFFYVRVAPKESVLILAMILGFHFKVPLVVPIIAGLYFGILSVIPVSIGVLIWNFSSVILELLKQATQETGGTVATTNFAGSYLSMVSDISSNENWMFIAFIFAMIILIVYVVSQLSIDYSKDLAIGAGLIVCIFGFVIASLVIDIQIGFFGLLISSIFSILIVFLIKFFDIVLDYQRSQRVSFEDENNYYYVKIIPKINIAPKKKIIKRIRPRPYDEEFEEDFN